MLASLGGLDTALREHFAGFRSHSSLLAGLSGGAHRGVGLFFGRAPWFPVAVAAGYVRDRLLGFRRAFRRRAGGRRSRLIVCRAMTEDAACSSRGCTTSR